MPNKDPHKPSDHTPQTNSPNQKFTLLLGQLPILTLHRHPQGWTIHYTETFKKQSQIAPLIPFPNVNKAYHSPELWPFFSVRIPSIARPKIHKTVRQEQLNYNDTATMLQRFGRRSITDPFELIPE